MGQALGRRWRAHWHHAVLTGLMLVSALVYGRHGGQSWHFLATGAKSLACSRTGWDPCGLHVYAQHPDIQVGPLSLAVAALLVLPRGSADGFDVARVAMLVAGLVVLVLVESSAPVQDEPARRLLRRRTALAGLAFCPAWADLAVGFGHLDDVLALVFTTGAVHAVVRGRPRACGWWLALAVLAKPWALAFLPLLLALPRQQWRPALTRALAPVALVVAAFALADPGSSRAAHYRVRNAPASSLRTLGVTAATPPWDRPAQLVLGWLLGAGAVALRRWRSVVMIGAACRVMLDPEVYSYYTAGVLVGTVLWDLQVRLGRTIPLWSWAAFAALSGVRYLPVTDATLGALRLLVCLTLITFCLAAPGLLGRLVPGSRRAPRRAATREG